MKRKHRNYEDSFYETLKNHDEALGYLNAALADEDQQVFLLALKDVLTAQNIDISAFAQEAELSRQNIYRMLSSKGNPRWDNLSSLLHAMGYQVKLAERTEEATIELPPIDKKLHKKLAMLAARKGLELNEFISKKLSQ